MLHTQVERWRAKPILKGTLLTAHSFTRNHSLPQWTINQHIRSRKNRFRLSNTVKMVCSGMSHTSQINRYALTLHGGGCGAVLGFFRTFNFQILSTDKMPMNTHQQKYIHIQSSRLVQTVECDESFLYGIMKRNVTQKAAFVCACMSKCIKLRMTTRYEHATTMLSALAIVLLCGC